MELVAFSILATLMGLLYLFIGYKTSQKIGSITDFFLAGKNIGVFGLTMSLVATQLGSGAILGTSQEAYQSGILAFAYTAGISIGFLLLASGFAQRLRAQNVNTIAQIFEKRYKSSLLTKVASLISIASLGGILVAQIVGSKALLLSLNVYSPILFISLWTVVILYTMMGGLKAVISNNTFQLLFIIAVFVLLFFFDLLSTDSSFSLTQSWSKGMLLFSEQDNSFVRFLTIALTPALYSLFEQDIAQTIIAAKNKKVVLIGTISAALTMIMFVYIPFYFGIQAAATTTITPAIALGAQPLMSLIAYKYGFIVQILVLYGILAAVLSTANSLLCAISSHVTQDFNLTNNNSHTKANLRIPKLVTLAVGAIAFSIAQSSHSIINILILSYLIPVATIFVPIIAAYFLEKTTTTGAYISIIFGSLGYLATTAKILPSWGIWITIIVSGLLYSAIIFYKRTQYTTR